MIYILVITLAVFSLPLLLLAAAALADKAGEAEWQDIDRSCRPGSIMAALSAEIDQRYRQLNL